MGSLAVYLFYTSLILIIYIKSQKKWLKTKGKIISFKKKTTINRNYLNIKNYYMYASYEFYTLKGVKCHSKKISAYEYVSAFLCKYSFYDVHKVEILSKRQQIDVYYSPLTGKSVILKVGLNKSIFMGLLASLLYPFFMLFFLNLNGFYLLFFIISILLTGALLILLDEKIN